MISPFSSISALDAEQHHARPEWRRHGFLHPSSVGFVYPGLQIADEVVVDKAFSRHFVSQQSESAFHAYRYLAVSAQQLAIMTSSFAALILGTAQEVGVVHLQDVRMGLLVCPQRWVPR